MRESCLIYCYCGVQSLFEVVLLYTFYTIPTFGSSVNVIFFLFQPHRNRGVKDGYQILSWDKKKFQACTGLINPVLNPYRPEIFFFRPYFHYCLSSAHHCEDHFHSWIFIKGMYHWRGSLCLSSSNGHHERGKFTRIESLVPNISVIEPNVFSFITVW